MPARRVNSGTEKQEIPPEGGLSVALIEHDPEKWIPVFRKDHAQTKA